MRDARCRAPRISASLPHLTSRSPLSRSHGSPFLRSRHCLIEQPSCHRYLPWPDSEFFAAHDTDVESPAVVLGTTSVFFPLNLLTRERMGFDQYHEPPDELPAVTRTFARMITSLIEEAEAIGWYEQRIALEKDREALAIMKNAQHEEMKHFGMDLEFLLRKKPQWRETLKGILFKKGDIVQHGDEAEEASEG